MRYSKFDATLANTRVNTWLKPLLDKPLSSITTTDIEKLVVKPMLEAGLSPGTIEAVIRLFSVIWHHGKNLSFYQGDSPTAKVKRPKKDNKRVRFLNKKEVTKLLRALKKRSIDAHDFALLSLFTGLRAGECRALTWADINFEDGSIFVKSPKNKKNRHAYITKEIDKMLNRDMVLANELAVK